MVAATKSKVKSEKEVLNYLNQLSKSLNSMSTHITKYTQNKESYPENIKQGVENTEEVFRKLTNDITTAREMVVEVCRKKRKNVNGNLGLKTPQYVTENVLNFINNYGNLPKKLMLHVNDKGYGVIDRSTLTTFWSYYTKTNNLKNLEKKGMMNTNSNMKKLFSSKIRDPDYRGKTYFQMMIEEVESLQQNPNYNKENSNRAQYVIDPNTNEIQSFNNASLQILIKPFFRNDYKITNKDDYVEHLAQLKNFFKESTSAHDVTHE